MRAHHHLPYVLGFHTVFARAGCVTPLWFLGAGRALRRALRPAGPRALPRALRTLMAAPFVLHGRRENGLRAHANRWDSAVLEVARRDEVGEHVGEPAGDALVNNERRRPDEQAHRARRPLLRGTTTPSAASSSA